MKIPIITCVHREDFVGGLKFFCDYCRRWHLHGRGEGHRLSHCSNNTSPYDKTGYYLVLRDGGV